MEGVRGFAVFLVFIVHYVTLIEPWLFNGSSTYIISENIRSVGNTGVDIFFVLSGYLIYGMLIKKHVPFRRYILRRIQRIYPVFTAVFIVYLVLSFIIPSESKIPGNWFDASVFILQNYLLMPGLFDVQAIITVAWSLSYEFFYYLFIPFLIVCTVMRSWESKYRLLFFIIVSVFLFHLDSFERYIGLIMFFPGILVFEMIENSFFRTPPKLGLISLFIAIIVVIFSKNYNVGTGKYICLYVLLGLFCLDCFSGNSLAARIFSATYLRWLGNMSYSYYLLHGLTLKATFMALNKIFPANHADNYFFWILLPPFFFITLIPSAFLFVFVEKPYSLLQKK